MSRVKLTPVKKGTGTHQIAPKPEPKVNGKGAGKRKGWA